MRPRHSDADLVELAREGSAPAFASLLHRHRDVVARGALRAEHPQQVAEATVRSAIRQLHRGRAPAADVRAWMTTLVEGEVQRDPGRPDVERLLPTDWFDRTWVRAERTWPTGRRTPRPPRWASHVIGAVALAAGGSLATYMITTSEVTSDVISELVAEPVDDPDVLVVPGPTVDAPVEEAPELFGDVELGELPTYDLTGETGRRPANGPTIAPPASGEAERTDDTSAGGQDDAGVPATDDPADEPATDEPATDVPATDDGGGTR